MQKKKEEEEKRLQRAQKFGLNTAETIEQKRQMRAVKFGMAADQLDSGSGIVRKVTTSSSIATPDDKLNARAVRFGLGGAQQ